MDIDDLVALFVEAIADQRLKAEAARLIAEGGLSAEARALAETAVDTCAAISARMADVQREAVAALGEAGVRAEALGEIAEKSALQFHSAGLGVARADLGPCLDALDAIGFKAPIEMTPARVAALSATAQHLQLVRFDAQTTRLILHFEGNVTTVLPRGLRPRTADLAFVSLPVALAWSYGLVKPFRVLHERVTGKRSPHHEIDFLGTPEALIAPILRNLGLGTEDVLLDLGCGDGRVLEVAASGFGCRAIGVEHNRDLVLKARARAAASGLEALIEVREGSAGTADLSEATVVFVFLPRGVLHALMPSVLERLGTGARLVMHEQSRPGEAFAFDQEWPVFADQAITVVRVKKSV